MTTISPTRVSMYDFLYHDTQPMVSLLADVAHLSLSQTRLGMDASLQAIVSALLAYQQRHQGQSISKKLFGRGAVKELRQYNSMNFATLNATLYHRHEAADAIFHDSSRVLKASEYIATKIESTAQQAQILLTSLCTLALRELAILAEYSQLDQDEINKWFALQPQFLAAKRFDSETPNKKPIDTAADAPFDNNKLSHNNLSPHNQTETESISAVPTDTAPVTGDNIERQRLQNNQLSDTPPSFDPYWYELTAFKPDNQDPVQDMELATGNYLKAIGRSSERKPQGEHNDSLMFAQMPNIALPHQRWLLQLAKISEIYLQRNRLRITSEPTTPPKPPLVNLGLISGNTEQTPATVSEKPIEYDAPTPLWKNPVILLIVLVIGGLGALATLKYQTQKSNGTLPATEAVIELERAKERQQQDVAIVMVDDEETTDEETADKHTASAH